MIGSMVAAAALAAAELAVDVPLRAPTPSPVWYELAAEGAQGDLQFVGQVGYETRPVRVAVAVSYQAFRGAEMASVSALAGGRVGSRTRLDVQVWRDVGRSGGGAGLVLRRSLGPKAR
jgi:hypothetical protein